MHELPLGWETAAPTFGFETTQTDGRLIRFEGEAPITIVAPTGAGKGVSFVVPACLTHTGPLFVVDVKGELTAVCRRRRLEMGHEVRVIDPFGVTGLTSDRLDPFDLFDLPGAMLEADSEQLAAMMSVGHQGSREPFWTDTGSSLISGLIAMSAAIKDEARPGFEFIRHYLNADDTPYSVAVLLDTMGRRNEFAYGELAAFLSHSERETRPSVLATARTFIRSLNSPQVAACLRDSTISLLDVVDGKPLDIFLVIPPEKLVSHAGFLRIVVGTIIAAIMRRREMPERRTLMLLDECAQLGEQFEPVLTATTLLRGYGLQLVTVWQDFAQIKSRYPKDWPTILNNSGAVLCFGQGHYAAGKDAGEFLGVDPGELMRMKPGEAALAVRGEGTSKIRRLDYLRDSMFAGMFDENPFHRRRGPER